MGYSADLGEERRRYAKKGQFLKGFRWMVGWLSNCCNWPQDAWHRLPFCLINGCDMAFIGVVKDTSAMLENVAEIRNGYQLAD